MKFDQMTPFMRSIIASNTKHAHHNDMMGYECRLFYIVEGAGALEIKKNPQTLKKGDIVLLNSGVQYRVLFPRKKVRHFMIKFDVDQSHTDIEAGTPGALPCDFDREKILSHFAFDDAPQLDEFCIIQGMDRVEKLIRQIYFEDKSKLIGWRTRANALLAEILVECMRHVTGCSETSRLNGVIVYLQTHYNLQISNADIAAKFGYHPNYLSSLFQKITGKTMHRYLLSLRIAHATELLETTALPVAQVAERCGFENAANFSAAFKKEMSMTPTQCRKKNRSK